MPFAATHVRLRWIRVQAHRARIRGCSTPYVHSVRQLIKTLVLTATFLLGACRSDESEWEPIAFDDEGDAPSQKTTTKQRRASDQAAEAIEAGDVRHLRSRAKDIHRALVKDRKSVV